MSSKILIFARHLLLYCWKALTFRNKLPNNITFCWDFIENKLLTGNAEKLKIF